MLRKNWAQGALVSLLVLGAAACSDDDDMGGGGSGGTAGDGDGDGDTGTGGGDGDGDGDMGTGGGGGATGGTTKFTLKIENMSATTSLSSPLAPGAFAVHTDMAHLFEAGTQDYGMGLSALAEDGDPSTLASSLMGGSASESGSFSIPVGATDPGAAGPGESYEFSFEAQPGDKLSLATMLVQTNDIVVATGEDGFALFDGEMPKSGDITMDLDLWDVGSERNEAPGQGATQAPRQGDTKGPMEGVVSPRYDGTRSVPAAPALIDVKVTETGGVFSIVVSNTSASSPLETPMSPVLCVLHESSEKAFIAGGTATAGLEQLAESGDPSTWKTELNDAGMIADVAGAGAFVDGEMVNFDVTPSATDSVLSLGTMIVHSNDLFVATPETGVALMDSMGNPRAAADVQADLMRVLGVWDAGTEENEVPGVGPNQPLQGGGATGAVDADPMIRPYQDATNDLMGALLSEKISVVITHDTGMTFDVLVQNTSTTTAYPLALTPVAWATHEMGTELFAKGMPASPGLEKLAEDGMNGDFVTEIDMLTSVGNTGSAGAGAIAGGENFTFKITVAPSSPAVNMVSMVVPSNDTFWSLGLAGVELLTSAGAVRPDAEIALDVDAALVVYEAGTEANQSGAQGPDMAPHQAMANTGAAEGDSSVRKVSDIWWYPDVTKLVRATLTAE